MSPKGIIAYSLLPGNRMLSGTHKAPSRRGIPPARRSSLSGDYCWVYPSLKISGKCIAAIGGATTNTSTIDSLLVPSGPVSR